MNELQQRLAQPFDPKFIEWLPGSTTKDGSKCMAMPYADMRAYMVRLDELFGLEWSVRYVAWGDTRIFCELTINGVTRTSTGESDAQDAKNGLAGTVAEAQAFKRACAMFGLGRYLYDLPSAWVAYDSQYKRISDAGKAELESRYKTWYARQTAQARPEQRNGGTQAQSGTQATKTQQQPATPASEDGGTQESPPHQRLWGIGKSTFGPDWDNGARAWIIDKWTGKVSPNNVRDSATNLSDDEKTQLGDYINEHVTTLQRIWKSHKAAEMQSTGQKVAA